MGSFRWPLAEQGMGTEPGCSQKSRLLASAGQNRCVTCLWPRGQSLTSVPEAAGVAREARATLWLAYPHCWKLSQFLTLLVYGAGTALSSWCRGRSLFLKALWILSSKDSKHQQANCKNPWVFLSSHDSEGLSSSLHNVCGRQCCLLMYHAGLGFHMSTEKELSGQEPSKMEGLSKRKASRELHQTNMLQQHPKFKFLTDLRLSVWNVWLTPGKLFPYDRRRAKSVHRNRVWIYRLQVTVQLDRSVAENTTLSVRKIL